MEHRLTRIHKLNNKLKIEIDGEYHLFLYERDLRKKQFKGIIAEETILTEEDITMLDSHAILRGKRRVYYLLGKQDYAVGFLKDKLRKDGYIEEHVESIMIPFIEKGFVDDKRLIERKVDQYKGYKSRKEIKYNLMRKGMEANEIEESLKEVYLATDEEETAYHLLNKKFGLKKIKLERDELYKKGMGYLSRKGFSFDICRRAFNRFISDKS